MNYVRLRAAVIFIAANLGLATTNASAQPESSTLTKEDLRSLVANVLSDKFPQLDFKYVSAEGSNTESGYAIGYDWSWKRNNLKYVRDNSDNVSARDLNISLFANGTLALQDTTNPSNLSEAGFSFDYIQANLGNLEKRLSTKQSVDYQNCLDAIDTTDREEYDAESKQCVLNHGVHEVHQANQADNWVYGGNLNAKIEANEDYSQKQYVYGIEGFFSVKPHPESKLKNVNIFDYPFRATRSIFPAQEEFVPSWPVFRLGVQTVDVKDNDPRMAIAPAEDSFDRVFGEVAFNTVIAYVDDIPIKINFSYRIYEELDATSMIKAAGLDKFDYFSASIQVPANLLTGVVPASSSFFVSYTDGKLPFDRESTRSYQVGWQTNLNLGSLMGGQ